jgi:hypothetical protein
VGWVLAALAVGGWSVEPSSDRDRKPPVPIADAARTGVAQLTDELAVTEESPALTLGVVASAAAVTALVLGARIVVSALAKAHPPTRLAPSHAHVPASSEHVTRRRLPRAESAAARH